MNQNKTIKFRRGRI